MPTPEQLRDEYIIETKIDDQASAAAGQVADQLNRLDAAAGTVTKSVAGTSDGMRHLAAEAEAAAEAQALWEGRTRDATRGATSFNAAIGTVVQSQRAMADTASQGGIRIAEFNSSFQVTAARVDNVTKSANALEATIRRFNTAQTQFQADLAAGNADLEQGRRVFDAFGTSIDTAAKKLATVATQRGLSTGQLQQLGASLTPQGQQALTTALPQVQNATALSATAAAQANARLVATLNDGEGASKRMSFAMRDLGLQSIDMFQGIATGQPIFRTFIQQGAQVAQVNAAAGISMKAFGGAIVGALLSPLGLAIAGFAALGGAAAVVVSHAVDLEAQQRTLAVSLAATGRAADVSAASLQGYITQLKAAGASGADATSVVNALARDRGINQSQIGQIVSATPDLAAALGTDNTTAMTKLKDVADGAADSVKSLNDALGFLSPAQETAANSALKHGDAAKALSIVLADLLPRITGLHEQGLSPAAAATNKLSAAWDAFVTSIANSRPVLAELQGWAIALSKLSGASPDMGNLTGQLTSLQFQAAKLKGDLAAVPDALKTTTAFGEGQNQLTAINQQITAIEGKIEAAKSKIPSVAAAAAAANNPPASANAPPDRTPPKALDISRLAADRAASSTPGQIATYKQEIADFRSELDKLGPRTAANAQLFDNLTGAIVSDQKAMTDLQKKSEGTRTSFEKQTDTLRAQITAQTDLNAVYAQGGAAVAHVTAQQEAAKQAISDGLIPGTKKYIAAINELIPLEERLIQTRAQGDIIKQTAANQDSIAVLQLETQTLGQNDAARTAMIEHLKAEQTLKRDGIPLEDDVARGYLASVDALTRANAVYTQQKSALDDLANGFTQAFDQISQAITTSFLSGTGAAVNFGNIFKSVVQQVISEFAKLAILNPLKNSLFGQNNSTLSSAISAIGSLGSGGSTGSGALTGALGTAALAARANDDSWDLPGASGSGAAGAAGSSPSFLSNLSNLLSFGSTANSLSSGGITNLLGLKNLFSGSEGSVGLFDTGGFFGSGGQIANLLSTPIYGSVSPVATNAALSALGPGVYGPETAAQFTAAGGQVPITLGSALGAAGAVGAGFGAGSLAGGYVQSALGKTGPAPQIGAGLGAAVGVGAALLAPETFGASLLLAGIIGGLGGGLGGGAIGPMPATPYSEETIVS